MVELTPLGEEIERIFMDPRCKSQISCFGVAVDKDKNRKSEPESGPKPIPMYEYPADFDWAALAELEGPRLQDGSFVSPALMEVINNPNIMVTKEMLPVINDPKIVVTKTGQPAMTLPAKKMSGLNVIRRSGQFSRQNLLPDLKKKRKVSKYQKEFGRQLKKLKAKHPRTKIKNLMKRAHAATRKVLK